VTTDSPPPFFESLLNCETTRIFIFLSCVLQFYVFKTLESLK
jgi:hypothetical protein